MWISDIADIVHKTIFLQSNITWKKEFLVVPKISRFCAAIFWNSVFDFLKYGHRIASLLLQGLSAKSNSLSSNLVPPEWMVELVRYLLQALQFVASLIVKWKRWELPCSFGLTGRVHEEECDENFSVFLFRKQRMVLFFSSF